MRFPKFLTVLIFCLVPLVSWGQETQFYKEPLLADAQEGEWAKYKMQGGVEIVYKILKVEDKKITIQTETFRNGKSVNKQENVVDLEAQAEAAGEAPEQPEGTEVAYSDVTLEINGKELSCKLMETKTQNSASKTWMSKDVPVHGIVKVEANGNVAQELVDWGGNAEGASEGEGEATEEGGSEEEAEDPAAKMPAIESADPEKLKPEVESLINHTLEGPMAKIQMKAIELYEFLFSEKPEEAAKKLDAWLKEMKELDQKVAEIKMEQAPTQWLMKKFREATGTYVKIGEEVKEAVVKKDMAGQEKAMDKLEEADKMFGAFESGFSKLMDWAYGTEDETGEEEEGTGDGGGMGDGGMGEGQ